MKKFLFYWFPIILYCLLIFIQSSYPSFKNAPELPYIDKMLHFVAYALLGALFLRAFKTSRIKNNLKLMLILSFVLSSLYGISDEIHQYFVPYRDADFMDVLADMLGGIMGVYIYQAMARKISAG
ncbi:MAG: VanZ family protein [Desulfobacterales bacterium]